MFILPCSLVLNDSNNRANLCYYVLVEETGKQCCKLNPASGGPVHKLEAAGNSIWFQQAVRYRSEIGKNEIVLFVSSY